MEENPKISVQFNKYCFSAKSVPFTVLRDPAKNMTHSDPSVSSQCRREERLSKWSFCGIILAI